jgi:hypothetical protein
MTTSAPPVPAQSTHQNSVFDSHNIINMALMTMISEQMTSILKSSDGLTINKITKMLAIMSMDEIRKSVMTFIKKFFDLITTNHVVILEWINKYLINNIIFSHIINFFKYIISFVYTTSGVVEDMTLIPDKIIKLPNSIDVEVEAILPFMQILIEYIKKNKNLATYKIINEHSIVIENLEKIVLNEKWTDININYEDVNININSILNLSFERIKNKLLLSKFQNIKIQDDKAKVRKIDTSTVECLTDLIQDEAVKKAAKYNINSVMPELYKTKYNNVKTSIDGMTFGYVRLQGGHSNGNYAILNFIEFLESKLPKLNPYIAVNEFIYLMAVNKVNESILVKSINTVYSKIFVLGTEFDVLAGDTKYFANGVAGLFASVPACMNRYEAFKKYAKIDNYIRFVHVSDDASLKLNRINFNISSNFYPVEQLYSKFEQFVRFINSYIEKKEVKEPVKSFVIMIKETDKIETVSNPEFIEYNKQKQNITEMSNLISATDPPSDKEGKKNKKKDNVLEKFTLQKSMRDFVMRTIPPETIEKVVTNKEVIVTEINEIYKSFNTLYLRKDDGTKLKNILEMFYDNNDLMLEMGIPNKLGILLHGIPGTGKSSAIAAIATYLKKNVYCVDFKTIKTNNDFMLVVDYVNKHCVGGGILTFEDFDAMGSVLHKRLDKLTNDVTVTALHNSINETLTLDYILNVFQGSLTPSGFVFIATTNHLNMLDDALYRDGRFDVKIEMKLCDHYQIQSIYNKLLKRDIPPRILKKIKEDKWTPANIIFRIIHYVKGDYDDNIILEPFLE